MKLLMIYSFILLVVGLASCRSLKNGNHGLGIIDGKPVPITEYPFMVAFRIDTFFSGSGVIINDRWILTQISNTEAIRFLDLYIGSNRMEEGQQVGMNKVVVNPKYDGMWAFDVALIKTVRPMKFSKKVQAVKLATDFVPAGTVGSVAGWGITSEVGGNAEDSKVLRAANYTVRDDADCKKEYETNFNKNIFCTTDEKAGPDTDDNGSPFMVNNTMYGMYVGGWADYPRVYVKISSIVDWVQETIKEK